MKNVPAVWWENTLCSLQFIAGKIEATEWDSY